VFLFIYLSVDASFLKKKCKQLGGYIEMAFQPDLNHIDKREKERTCHQWKTQESFNKATVEISTSMPW